MLAPQTLPLMTEAEYLEMEQHAHCRHEFIDGHIYAKKGGSRLHNKITTNIGFALHQHIKGSACEVYLNDVKLKIAQRRSYYYPDIMLGCSSEESDDYCLTQPCLIIEVLSPATARTDKREKLIAYQSIPSLREYCLVSPRKFHLERYHRVDEASLWHLTIYEQGDLVSFACIDFELAMSEIYTGVLDHP